MDRSSPLPLWAQLRDRLARAVDAGELSDGFPTEFELACAFRVSRQTVREALRDLRATGRVVAGRGRRRQAVSDRIEAPLGALYSLFAAVEAAGLSSASIVRALDQRRDAAAASRLGLEPPAALVYLERVRLADGEPLALDRLWMPAALAAPLLGVDFTHAAFYDELARHCGLRLSHGRERIQAEIPTTAQRRLLHIAGRTAVLRIERLALWRSRPAETRITLVRGDRFGLSAEWSPELPYAVHAIPAPPEAA